MGDAVENNDSFKDIFHTTAQAFLFAWKKEKGLVISTYALTIALQAITFLQLASFSNIINEIIRIHDFHSGITHILIQQSVILGISFLIPALLGNLQSKYNDAFSIKLATHLRLHLADSFASLDIGTIQGAEFQSKLELTERWGTGAIINVVRNGRKIVGDLTAIVTSVLLLLSINAYLIILAILGTIMYYFVEQKYGRRLFLLYYTENDDYRIENDRYNLFREPKKIVEVLLFNMHRYLRVVMKTIATKNDAAILTAKAQESRAIFGADVVQMLCLLGAIFFVTMETIQGKILIGSLLLAFSVYRSFVTASQTFFNDFAYQQDQTRFAKRWFDVFEIKPAIVSKPHAIKPSFEKPPVIEFRNVSFTYPETDKMILADINLTLQSGEKLAIVGENGAGKTTLIKLLCRIYDPSDGTIFIDGIDLKDIDLMSWREYTAVLFQDFNNYQMTVREAIAIAKSDSAVNDAKVKHAAQLAGADEFIQTLPKKYEQLLWKGFQDGVELSKGQYQRMAVARIFYRDALISVLDEPTSAIDAVAEEKIFEVLETKMEGKTVVLISHRFSTVKNADKIAVIEHGELKELGSHKELMEKNGRYAELYSMQAKRYLESE